MHHRLLTLACTFYALSGLTAQTAAPSVIASEGGTGVGAGIRIDYTLGELAVDGLTGQPASMTEGFQQPYLLIELVPDNPFNPGEVSPTEIEALVSMAPNPVSASLTVSLNREMTRPLTLGVRDANGILMYQSPIDPAQGDSQVDMSGFPPGVYYFQFRSADREWTATYKIVKIQ